MEKVKNGGHASDEIGEKREVVSELVVQV